VEQIARRGRLPILCGGSGFYVSALLGGLPPGPALTQGLRPALARWARMRGPEAAHRFLSANDPVAAARIPAANLKYTLRALEILLSTGEAASARAGSGDDWAATLHVRKLGLLLPRAQLHARIEDRVRRMLESGWGEEVRRLLEGGLSRDSNSFQAIGYREVAEWMLGRISREEAEEQIVSATRSLAKRQMTWFARERDIRWVGPEEGLAAGRALLSEATDEETR
jgi:tRNA dimethylallyltransferase